MPVKLTPRWSVLIIFMAILLLFWPAILYPNNILFPTFSPFSDLMVIHWPKAHLMAQSWQAGDGLPYWTPLILSGMPLAANQLAMLFYPPAWLFLIFPIEPIFNVLFVFHFLLGGVGVYLLLRKAHALSPGAALMGSLTFALNGKWLAHAAGGHVSLVGAIGWLPWAVFGMMMLLKQAPDRETGKKSSLLSGLGWSVLVAVALSMQIFTHTLLLIYAVYLLAAMVAWHFIFFAGTKDTPTDPAGGLRTPLISAYLAEIKRLWLPLVSVPILAALLGAVQLLPLLELTHFSNRTLSLSEASEFAVTLPQLILGLILPSVEAGHELVIYLGLMPLLLAPFGLTGKNRWSWFYGALFLFTILFALGPSTPVHSLFYHLAPGFRWVRTPARLFFVGGLAVAALVGFGVDRLAQERWSPTSISRLTRLAVAVGALALLTGLGLATGFDLISRATLALAILVPLGLGLIVLWTRRVISNAVAVILLGILLLLDLAFFDTSMMRFVSPEEALATGHPAAAYLSQKPGQFRLYSPSYSLPMHSAAAADLHLADGVEPVHLAAYDQFMARAGGYNDASFSVTIPLFGDRPLESALQDTKPNLKLLGLLNVQYLAAAFPMNWPGLIPEAQIGETFIYRNEHALPKAWIAHQTISAEPDWLTQLERLPNLSKVVITEHSIPSSGATSAGTPATVTGYSADLIEVETELSQPGWLVLSEIWYPGWQATVNGGPPQPVAKVDGLLRGLYLSQPGQYQIIVEYRPSGVVWGRWISGLSAVLLIVGGTVLMLRNRWHTTSDE